MDLQAQRDLKLLNEVERDGNVTQRTLAKSLGVALGLTNLYLKRLAHKGYIKITTIPKHRIKYLLTPRGVAEKSRLTYEYMQYSLYYYRDVRQRLKQALSTVTIDGPKKLVIYGTGELAELAYLTVRDTGWTLVGFADGRPEQTFLTYPLVSIEGLSRWEFDAILVTDIQDTEKVLERIISAQVPRHKVITLCPEA
jgi:DNA-binding Lrp family transcriptional regulator